MKKNDDELRIIKNAEGELRIQKGTVLKYIGDSESVTIPKGVVRIAPYAFSECKNLKKVITPVKLSSIGKGAFYGCDALEEVTLPGRLYRRVNGGKVFPDKADIYFRFYATAGDPAEDEDYSDVFNSEAEYLAAGGDDIKMTQINVVPTPAPDAQPIEVVPPAPAEPAVDSSFVDEIQNEQIITVEETLPPEPEPEEHDDYEEPETLRDMMDAVVPEEEPEGSDVQRHELVNLADYLIEDDKVIKYIGAAKETTVPKFITTIGEGAFANTDVEVVHLPDNLEIVGKNAFSWCQRLTGISLPDNVHLIDDGAFSNCNSLAFVNFPRNLKFIGANAFRACTSLKKIDLPSSLVSINRRAFDFCIELERVTIPEGIKKISEGMFSHCESLNKVNLPSTLTEIDAWAFAECYELREINFPEGLERIGDVAFLNCRSLVAFDLPKTQKSLGRQAFVGCLSLHLVNMPKRLQSQVVPNKVFHRLPQLSINYND